MADMQVAVRLRWKSCGEAAVIFTGLQILVDDCADEIDRRPRRLRHGRLVICWGHATRHFMRCGRSHCVERQGTRFNLNCARFGGSGRLPKWERPAARKMPEARSRKTLIILVLTAFRRAAPRGLDRGQSRGSMNS